MALLGGGVAGDWQQVLLTPTMAVAHGAPDHHCHSTSFKSRPDSGLSMTGPVPDGVTWDMAFATTAQDV